MLSILIGVGANLPNHQFSPRETCGAALLELAHSGINIVKRSSWYSSAPVPNNDQPWYVNAAVAVKTDIGPGALLDILLGIEQKFGRIRKKPKEERVIDLDILTYNNLKINTISPNGHKITVPHPEISQRAFVLMPIRDIDPNWYHPRHRTSVNELIKDLPSEQKIHQIKDANGLFGSGYQGN